MKMKRLLSLFLSMCLLLLLVPTAKASAEAASVSAISIGTGGISGEGANWIYYGEYNKSPIKWRVLSTKGNGGLYLLGSRAISNPLFLISEYTLDCDLVQFDTTKNAWKDSSAQKWCKSFYNSNFDSAERNAIAATKKSDTDYLYFDVCSLSGDNVFFLSGEEAQNTSFGFTADSKRTAYSVSNSSLTDSWWLRSPYSKSTTDAGLVDASGSVGIDNIINKNSARPALNLDTSAILFSSAIGLKTSGAVGAGGLMKISSSAPTEWKLTLLDSTRNFDIYENDSSSPAGGTITLNYSGATIYSSTAPNEYISAMIVDSNGTVQYYGRLKQPTNAVGSINITIPSSLATGTYALKLFSEQCNSNYETDFASDFCNVTLKVDNTVPTVTAVSPNGTSADVSGNVTLTFSEAMNTKVKGNAYIYIDGSSEYTAVLGGGTWSRSNTVYTVPYSGLSYGTKYTILITGFTDNNGFSILSDSSHTFTTKLPSGTYIIDSTSSPGGYITPSGRSYVAKGSAKTYSIAPSSGYKIDHILVDGVNVGAVASYTFKNVTTSHSITAFFDEINYADVLPGSWYYGSVMNVSSRGLMVGSGGGYFSPEGKVTRGMMVTILYKLNGNSGTYPNVFVDVSRGSWYENSVSWAAANGVVAGVGNNRFAPETNVTREQLAVMLYNYSIYKGYDVTGSSSNLSKYTDAKSISAWASSAMTWAVSKGIISGDGTYLNPKANATRAQVAVMIERFINVEHIG